MNTTKIFVNYYWYLLLINIQKLPGGKTPLNIICSWKTLKNLPSTIFIFCLIYPASPICKVALPGISYSNICSEISDTVFIQILKSLERHVILRFWSLAKFSYWEWGKLNQNYEAPEIDEKSVFCIMKILDNIQCNILVSNSNLESNFSYLTLRF